MDDCYASVNCANDSNYNWHPCVDRLNETIPMRLQLKVSTSNCASSRRPHGRIARSPANGIEEREKKELKHDISTKWIEFTAINQSIKSEMWTLDVEQTLSSDKILRQFNFSFCVRAFDCVCSIVHRPKCNSIVYSFVVWIESTTKSFSQCHSIPFIHCLFEWVFARVPTLILVSQRIKPSLLCLLVVYVNVAITSNRLAECPREMISIVSASRVFHVCVLRCATDRRWTS